MNNVTQRSVCLRMLGKRIAGQRKKLGLNQSEVSTASGLHRTYLSDVERGARNISFMTMLVIADSIQTTISDLCQGIDLKSLATTETVERD
ncbi:MAG TPA: helix-turn-helix transcriptional regulator [Verrucomicrobiae bacterium]|nr:helix-turn-helix transcriptional regulator [Verrucomicrobiae bacterium]